MNKLTNATRRVYALTTAPHWAGGFLQTRSAKAQEGLCRKVHAFFYALTVLVGGVLGGASLPVLSPVCKPDISSTAQSFAASRGGFKSLLRSLS